MLKTKIIGALHAAGFEEKNPEVIHHAADAIIDLILQALIDAAIRIHKGEEQSTSSDIG